MILSNSMVLLDSIDNVLKHLSAIKRKEQIIYHSAYDYLKINIKEKNSYGQVEMIEFRQHYFNAMCEEIFSPQSQMAADIFNEVIGNYNNATVSVEKGTTQANGDYKLYDRILKAPDALLAVNAVTENINFKQLSSEAQFSLGCALYLLTDDLQTKRLKSVCKTTYKKYINDTGLQSLRNAIAHSIDNGCLSRLSDGIFKVNYNWNQEVKIDAVYDSQKLFSSLEVLATFGILVRRSLAYLRIDSVIYRQIKSDGGNVLERQKVSLE